MEATDNSAIQRDVTVVGVHTDDTIWVKRLSCQERVCRKGGQKQPKEVIIIKNHGNIFKRV